MKTSVQFHDDSHSPNIFYIWWTLLISRNSGPPEFMSPINDLSILINIQAFLILPKIQDPDNDSYTIEIKLGKVAKFALTTGTSITFNPKLSDIG